MEPIAFTTKTEYKESLKLSLLLYFQSAVFKLIYIAGTCLILFSIFVGDTANFDSSLTIIASVVVMILIPLIAFLKIRKSYRTNRYAGMEAHWVINESGVNFKQSTVAIEIGWDRINKVSDKKKWILIGHNKKILFFIQKRYLSLSQMDDFKKLINQMRKIYLIKY
jgi:YcxB-like protein